jgi:hypothetical protein
VFVWFIERAGEGNFGKIQRTLVPKEINRTKSVRCGTPRATLPLCDIGTVISSTACEKRSGSGPVLELRA